MSGLWHCAAQPGASQLGEHSPMTGSSIFVEKRTVFTQQHPLCKDGEGRRLLQVLYLPLTWVWSSNFSPPLASMSSSAWTEEAAVGMLFHLCICAGFPMLCEPPRAQFPTVLVVFTDARFHRLDTKKSPCSLSLTSPFPSLSGTKQGCPRLRCQQSHVL